MLITVKTFNGFTLNSTDYQAAVLRSKTPPDANLVFLEQAKADALYAGTFNINVRSIPVGIRILDLANLYQREAELKEALRPGTRGELVVTFGDNGQDYEMDCTVQSIVAGERGVDYWQAILQSGDSCWRKVQENTAAWDVVGNGDAKVINVGGYSPTRLSMTMSANTLPATGWAYQQLYKLVNAPGYDYGLRPWCISLDTGSLIGAGKMQTDCDDLLVIVDGKIVPRWIAYPNSSATKIWFNLDLAAGWNLKLGAAIGASGGVTAIQFKICEDSKAALLAMPKRGFLVHGSEWFEYTGRNASTCTVTISTRGALGTTLQAHSVGDIFSFVQHSIFLIYGNGSAAAPSTDDFTYDDTKPVFDLSQSSNTQWVYTATTKFYDADKPGRTGAWKSTLQKSGRVSGIYLIKGNGESGDAAMGMRISTWMKKETVKSEMATLGWEMRSAGGIESISATGRIYRNTASWPGVSAAQCQKYGVNDWKMIWAQASPSSANSWEAVTKSGYAISPAKTTVRFSFSGSLAAQANVDCYFEILTATVKMVGANLPSGALQGEKGNLLLDVTITNGVNQDQVRLLFPMLMGKALVVDGEEHEVFYDGVNAHQALKLNDESRDIWLRLQPGANTLTITGNGVDTLDITLRWKERRL